MTKSLPATGRVAEKPTRATKDRAARGRTDQLDQSAMDTYDEDVERTLQRARAATLGGELADLRCPRCGHTVQLLDRRFLKAGPIRCGGCGSELQGGGLSRLIEISVERPSA